MRLKPWAVCLYLLVIMVEGGNEGGRVHHCAVSVDTCVCILYVGGFAQLHQSSGVLSSMSTLAFAVSMWSFGIPIFSDCASTTLRALFYINSMSPPLQYLT